MGGFLTLFAYVIVLALTFAVIDTYFNFNESVSQALIPRDDEFVNAIRSDFSFEAVLQGYSGECFYDQVSRASLWAKWGVDFVSAGLKAHEVGEDEEGEPTELPGTEKFKVGCDTKTQTLSFSYQCANCEVVSGPNLLIRLR